jgi:predicted nucleotide-binding protein
MLSPKLPKVIRMASRQKPPVMPERPNLSTEQKLRAITRLKQRITELEAFDPQKVTKRFNIPEVKTLETSIDEALSVAFGHGTVEYRRYSRATHLDHGPVTMSSGPDLISARMGYASYERDEADEARQYLTEGKEEALALLRRAVTSLEEELADEVGDVSLATPATESANRKIFVVHGHDEATLQTVARFLEQLGLEAIILKEQPDQGRTIIEKFEDCAREVGFAVVLLTPDDLVASAAAVQLSQARQNVIFELGYFVGRLGRGRACLLRRGDVEIPSDLFGVIYSELDAGGGWKVKLVQEMKAAHLPFDANRLWAG